MRRVYVAAVFAAALSLGGLLSADDTVVLNDGSTLQGQVMQETSSQVVLMDHGVQRTLDRSLVAKVEFNSSPSSGSATALDDASGGNTGPSGGAAAAPADGGNTVPSAPAAPAGDAASVAGGGTVPSAPAGDAAGPMDGGNTVPAAPTQEEQDYAGGVSAYYQVPTDQVWGFEQQGIPYEELPVVFYVARRAQCAPGLVVGLRLRGMSWADICMHFGLEPGIFYWRDIFRVNLGGPYAGIYLNFRHFPHRRWRWGILALSDADIINCVNLRFTTAYWHCTPFEVARWRGMGHPYFWGGYGHAGFRGRGGRIGGRVGYGRGVGQGGRVGYGQHGRDGNHVDRGQWDHN